MPIFKNPIVEQHKAEELGLVDKADRRIKDIGKPASKDESLCTVENCNEPKAPGQTYLCTKHIRSN